MNIIGASIATIVDGHLHRSVITHVFNDGSADFAVLASGQIVPLFHLMLLQ